MLTNTIDCPNCNKTYHISMIPDRCTCDKYLAQYREPFLDVITERKAYLHPSKDVLLLVLRDIRMTAETLVKNIQDTGGDRDPDTGQVHDDVIDIKNSITRVSHLIGSMESEVTDPNKKMRRGQ